MTQTGSKSSYTIRECLREDCGLRIPVLEDELPDGLCPRCGSSTRQAVKGALVREPPIRWASEPPCKVHVLLDNVRSTFNVGSILRVSDGVGANHVHLCGFTPTPDHRKVSKTALGAESSIAWTYYSSALDAAAALMQSGVTLWALENIAGSLSLLDCGLSQGSEDIALVVGNEITGIDPELLAHCDRILHIPMHGAISSLNVAVAFGIAAYWLRGNVAPEALIRRQDGSSSFLEIPSTRSSAE